MTCMNVQVYGIKKSSDTKKALRFFKERGVKPQFFDLKDRYMSKGELNRFIQKKGLDMLIDKKSKAYEKSGLEYMRLSNEQWLEKLIDEYELMVMPLVRSGNSLSVGWDEPFWKQWHRESKT